MPPRERKEDNRALAFFGRLMKAFRTEDVPRESTRKLANSGDPLLQPSVPRKAATDFYLKQAIYAFGLVPIGIEDILDDIPNEGVSLKWRIEDIPETQNFIISPCLHSLLRNYARNFERSSEAACRTALDFMLNECLTAIKGNNLRSEDQATGSQAQQSHTPSLWDDIKIFGEVSFSHMITRPASGRSVGKFLGTIANGRVDYGIGRVLPPSGDDTRRQPKRSFQSLLLVVEAKTAHNLHGALPQLVVYMASIHQSRRQRQRRDATVYGVVSDGYSYIFLKITHDGRLRQSRRFEVSQGEIRIVLGCLTYILEMSASISPNTTPEQDGGGPVEDGESDSEMDVDDNGYVTGTSPE